LRGASPGRARQILAGAVIVDETMTALGLESVQICPWALREGIALAQVEMSADTATLPLRSLMRPLLAAGPAALEPTLTPMGAAAVELSAGSTVAG
jgi:exopolyphosphatase/pppGpp-phosphohydrolase